MNYINLLRLKFMKHLSLFAAVAACAFIISSCSNEEDFTPQCNKHSKYITVNDVQVNGYGTQTRAYAQKTSWSTCDIIALKFTNRTSNISESTSITYDGSMWNMGKSILSGSNYSIGAFYPSVNDGTTINNDTDWLTGTTSISSSSTSFNLNMSHVMTQVDLKLQRDGYAGTGNLTKIAAVGTDGKSIDVGFGKTAVVSWSNPTPSVTSLSNPDDISSTKSISIPSTGAISFFSGTYFGEISSKPYHLIFTIDGKEFKSELIIPGGLDPGNNCKGTYIFLIGHESVTNSKVSISDYDTNSTENFETTN